VQSDIATIKENLKKTNEYDAENEKLVDDILSTSVSIEMTKESIQNGWRHLFRGDDFLRMAFGERNLDQHIRVGDFGPFTGPPARSAIHSEGSNVEQTQGSGPKVEGISLPSSNSELSMSATWETSPKYLPMSRNLIIGGLAVASGLSLGLGALITWAWLKIARKRKENKQGTEARESDDSLRRRSEEDVDLPVFRKRHPRQWTQSGPT
jgi:hypothetical protein